MATSPDQLVNIELIGPADNLSEATLMTIASSEITSSQAQILVIYMFAFLEATVPGYELNEWLNNSFIEIGKSDTKESFSINAGDNKVRIKVDRTTGIILLSVKPK
jgi:hypothetical protein